MTNINKFSVKLLGTILLLAVCTSFCYSKNNAAGNPDQVLPPAGAPEGFRHARAEVNGVTIHYVIGGTGAPLVLVHGFGENWYSWNRVMPELGKYFTLIVPDLRGIGESSKPDSGYDKKTMTKDIHELVKKLGYRDIYLAGHDIGLMVAYAYAASYRTEVKKLALLDAILPGVEPIWSDYAKATWWFSFFSRKMAGQLVEGRERIFFTDFWSQTTYLKDQFTKQEVDEFVRAYAQPGAIANSFKWYAAFAQDKLDNHIFMKQKLGMPVLTIAGEHHTAPYLATHVRLVANDVTEVVIPNVVHWLVQENTAATEKALMDFFRN